jgi:acetyl-CoA synthetase
MRMDQTGAVDNLLTEERVFRPRPQLVRQANLSPQKCEAARKLAAEDPLAFWEEAAEELYWFKRWDAVLDDSDAPRYRWFPGAQCNIVYNALDRHIETGAKNRLALIWEGEPGDSRTLTYYELYRAVNRFAAALRGLGVGKGDRVILYLPNLPETVIAMLATAKIGAPHCLVFAGFSAKALRERIRSTGAQTVITADGFYRNGQVVALKSVVDEALSGEDSPWVRRVIVVHRANLQASMVEGRDHWYADLVRQERPVAQTEAMDANDPLFILHTSGATGRPKGVVHSHGGYMVGVNRTFTWVFDVKDTDIFWCTADLGWVAGHTGAVYGPLMAGTTTLIYEGHPLYPQADRFWNIVSKYGVTILYTSPTVIRMLKRFGSQYPRRHDLATLRLLGSVGEPISPETWMWFHKHIGRSECPVLDTWWQTETGMFMVSPLPVSLLKPGSVGKALPGVEVEVVDREGTPTPPDVGGFLVVTRPWPGMMAALLDDREGLFEDYWRRIPGRYFAGDVARRDEDGYLWIQGRADDVLNIAGHRLGTAELESALVSHPDVAEAAVIGVPDAIKGEVAKGFAVLNPAAKATPALAEALRQHIRKELGPVAAVREVVFKDRLPRTRSGKLLRRALKAEELGQEPLDLAGLED